MAFQNVVDLQLFAENDTMEHAHFGYAERLLQGLNDIDWSESIKESQRNWIGKSVGATVEFNVQNSDSKIAVLQQDPILFWSYVSDLGSEHELVSQITTAEQKSGIWMPISKNVKTF
jgi:leucyl-tRNA synthetase